MPQTVILNGTVPPDAFKKSLQSLTTRLYRRIACQFVDSAPPSKYRHDATLLQQDHEIHDGTREGEPTVDEMLLDPTVIAMMSRDGVEPDDVRLLIRDVSSRLKCDTRSTVQPPDPPSGSRCNGAFGRWRNAQ